MFKTSRRSLLTALLALCTLLAQALVLAQPSTTQAAVVTVGPQIYLSPGSITRSGGNDFVNSTYVTVTGTGFQVNSSVAITFNAAYGTDGEPLAPRTVPPTINRPGDNRVGPVSPATTYFPNAVVACGLTDGNGNFVSAGTSTSTATGTCAYGSATGLPAPTAGAAVQIPIPNTAVDGTYEVTAEDIAGKVAATQFTINRESTPDMTADPISGTSVPIEGLIQIHLRPGAFQSYSPVFFYLTNFDLGVTSDPVLTPTGDNAVPLRLEACGSFSVAGPPPASCKTDAHGGVDAVVKLQTETPNMLYANGQDVGPFSPILSTEYFDQVFAILAVSSPITSGATAGAKHHGAITLPPGSIFYTAGIHIDHGKAGITLSTNQVSVGGAVVVSGTGFGADANVNLYFVPLLTGSFLCGDPLVSAVTGCPDNTSPFFYSPFKLGSTTADGNGSFTTTLGLNLTQLGGTGGIGTITGSGVPGYILAEDFSGLARVSCVQPVPPPVPPAPNTFIDCDPYSGVLTASPSRNYTANDPFGGAPRLNEAATAAVSIVNSGAVGGTGTLTITPQAVIAGIASASATTVTAAISATVTVTGTGFLPNEAVDIIISGSGSVSTVLPFGAPYPGVGATGPTCPAEILAVTHANQAGVAATSFLVPETCNTVTLSGGVINGGITTTVIASGEQSGLADSNTMLIPATTATITPSPATLNPANQGGIVTLTGMGFAANEPVTFQFGVIDPFTGALATPVLSVSTTSDVAGNASVPGLNLTANLTGGLYTLIARGLASGFAANISVTYPFVFINGNLNCPASAVLPGQPFTLTGSAFAPGTPVLVTLTQKAPPAVTLTSGIPAPIIAQTAYAGPSGTFTISNVTIPVGTAPGTYVISVTGLVANATSGSFQEQLRECVITVGTATPSIAVTPGNASIGQSVTVTGSGFGPSEPIQVTLQYSDVTGALTGTDVPGTLQVITNTTTTGTFSASYTVASSVNALIPGSYNVTAKGQQTGAIARAPLIVTAEPQAPLNTIYFAEGYTGTVAAGAAADFVETLSILNANNYTTTYTVTYSLEGPVSGQNVASGVSSTTKVVTGTLAPNSVVERSVNTDVGLNQKVAAEVSSPSPLGVERIISRSKAGKALDSDSSLGQLLDLTSTASAFSYYFAGGEVMLTNEEYLTLLNPTTTTASVTINILPQAVISATSVPTIAPIAVSVLGGARVTVPIRHDVEATGNGQLKFGMTVSSNVPLAAERVEYFGDGIGSGKYGATSKPGSSALFRQYIFSQDTGTFPSSGGTAGIGTGSDVSQVDIINPNPASAGSATVTVSFFDKSGGAINSQQVQVDGGTRETVNVNDVVGTQSDVFSVIVTSDKNVYAELPRFFGGDPNNGGTFAAAEPAGSPAGLTSVAFPYLDVTGPTGAAISQTVYLYNPGATAITVRGIYVSGSGGATVVKTYTVAANSITPVSVNTDASTLPKGAIGAIFQIVYVGTNTATPNTGASFVASAIGNLPDFSNVVGNQGTYPIGAATGF